MKNLKSNLMNLFTILLSTLVFVFLSQHHITSKVIGSGMDANLSNYDGYTFMNSKLNEPAITAMLILMAIFAGIVMVASIVNLLVNMDVIKSAKVSKIVNYTNIISAVFMFIFSAVAMFLLIDLAKEMTFVEDSPFGGIAGVQNSLGWGAVLNFIITFFAIIFACLAYKFVNVKTSKKTSKKKKSK